MDFTLDNNVLYDGAWVITIVTFDVPWELYLKTEKAQEQDGLGNKLKYHFHITTVHKYRFFVFCLNSSYNGRVYMEGNYINDIGWSNYNN